MNPVQTIISQGKVKVIVYVIPTDEELMIAKTSIVVLYQTEKTKRRILCKQ